MSRPIIGITTGRRNIWSALSEGQTAAVTCSLAYQQSVERSGGAPVLLPRTDDEAVVASVMSIVDGLLLSGGGDVVSLAYGAEPHPKTTYQDPIRDRMEFQAVRVAVERRLPILGICRGIQSLNVALGGTLVQDIHSEVPGASQHYTRERDGPRPHRRHRGRLAAGEGAGHHRDGRQQLAPPGRRRGRRGAARQLPGPRRRDRGHRGPRRAKHTRRPVPPRGLLPGLPAVPEALRLAGRRSGPRAAGRRS